jgi:hypothetical protein
MELKTDFKRDSETKAMRIEVFSQNSVAIELVKKLIADGLKPHLRTSVQKPNLVQLFFPTKDALRSGHEVLSHALTQIDHQAEVTIFNCSA